MDPHRFFKTFEDVEAYVFSLQETQYIPLRVLYSESVGKYNKKLKNPARHLDPNLRYISITYVCKHYGEFKSRSKGELKSRTNQHVLPSGCKYLIQFSYKRSVNAFMITREEKNHNHETGPNIIRHYPVKRKLSPCEEDEALCMMRAGASVSMVSDHIGRKTNKIVLPKDLYNLKLRAKRRNPTEVDRIIQIGEEFLSANSGSVFVLVVDENNVQDQLFLQSAHQKQIFSKFSEVLRIDVTWETDMEMPVFILVVDDCHGTSHIVACAVSTVESKDSFNVLLELFKGSNPSWENTKVILVDKDFSSTEITKEHFPQAQVFKCAFHLMKSINSELSSLKVAEKLKANILSQVKTIAKSMEEEEITGCLSELGDIQQEFLDYFKKNWMTCRDMWCASNQEGFYTVMNNTKNHIETTQRMIKKQMSACKFMSEIINVLIKLCCCAQTKMDHRLFVDKLYTFTSNECHPDIKPYFSLTTTYAANLIAAEYTASFPQKCNIVYNDDKLHVTAGCHMHILDAGLQECSCMFSRIMQLPCRHVFYCRRIEHYPTFSEQLVMKRFQKVCSSESNVQNHENVMPQSAVEVFVKGGGGSKMLNRHQKYNRVMDLLHKIGSACSELSSKEFNSALQSLEKVLICIQNRESIQITAVGENNILDEEPDSNLVIEEPASNIIEESPAILIDVPETSVRIEFPNQDHETYSKK